MLFYDVMLSHPRIKRDLARFERLAGELAGKPNVILPGIHTLPAAVVVDVTNVAAYYHEHHGWGTPDDFEAFVPNIAPPFPVSWWEYRVVDRMLATGRYERIGAHCQSVDLWEVVDEKDEAERQRQANRSAQMIADQTAYGPDGTQYDLDEWPTLASDVRWVSYWWNYILTGDGKVIGPLAEGRMFVTPDGKLAEMGPKGKYAFILRPIAITPETAEDDMEGGMKAAAMLFHPILLAIGFTHCKNVASVEGDLPPAKVRAKQEKKVGHGLTKFYTLEIDPMKRTLASEGSVGQNGLRRALHICRGHFAHYTEDKPLFGRVVGTVWRSAHVRGSADVGQVGKDYRIKPQTNGGAA